MGLKARSNGGDSRTVAGYVAGLDTELGAIAARLCSLIERAAPEATASIKWGQPVFDDGGPMCYFKAFRSHVTFGFWRGAELEGPPSVTLEGSGGRMRHIKLRSLADVDEVALASLVRKAAALNHQLGDPTRRRVS